MNVKQIKGPRPFDRNLTIWVGEFKFGNRFWVPCGAQACHGKEHALTMAKDLAYCQDYEGPIRVAKYKRVK